MRVSSLCRGLGCLGARHAAMIVVDRGAARRTRGEPDAGQPVVILGGAGQPAEGPVRA
jgi:hypothetical protein